MSIRNLFTKKRIIWGIIILIVALITIAIVRGKNNTDNILTDRVTRQNLTQSVLATGQVTSNIDLSLGFKSSGIVRRVNVQVGDEVRAGQLLANLDQKDQVAVLISARANLQRVLDGSSSEEVQVAQVALDNAIIQNDLAVENARRAYLNSSLRAAADFDNETDFEPTVSGTYNSAEEGVYRIYQLGRNFSVSGLETQELTSFSNSVPVPLGTRGLFLTFTEAYKLIVQGDQGDEWTIEIPNKSASNYVTNYNAYQTALKNREAAIAAAQANLDLVKAQARPADVEAARAQVLSAQAAVEATEIRAPAAGTITRINVKVGEQSAPAAEAVVLQDVDNLYLEANVSEANVALLKPGQEVGVTFDALGPDREFTALVAMVDPSSTVIAGVVNYKVTASIDQLDEIRPGMTANMSVQTGSKENVLAIPQRAVLEANGSKFVRVVTDTNSKTFVQSPVTTGLQANGGLIEILTGLTEGQEIVTFINQ